MPEISQYGFTHKELAQALIKHANIHEGIWGLFIKFGIQGANVGPTPNEIMPAAIIPILEVGLQKFEQESNIAVDAAKINPKLSKD